MVFLRIHLLACLCLELIAWLRQAFASPVLTLLLDIPWVATALSGWPLFGRLALARCTAFSGLMAQMSLRKAGEHFLFSSESEGGDLERPHRPRGCLGMPWQRSFWSFWHDVAL